MLQNDLHNLIKHGMNFSDGMFCVRRREREAPIRICENVPGANRGPSHIPHRFPQISASAYRPDSVRRAHAIP